jgi:hypothetical protein
MALQFNPPDWVIQEYLNRKTPYQEASQGLQQGIQNYAAFDQMKRQNMMANQQQQLLGMKQAEMGYDPNNPGAYWEQHKADKALQARLTESQINKNNRVDGEDQDSLEKILASKVRKGEMTIEDALRKKALGSPTLIKDASKAKKDEGKLDTTLAFYEEAKNGLLSGLSGSETGPIVGRLPAFTAAQQTAQGGVAAMAPALKQIFRVAGEGTFTDRDQALLMDMVPTRADRPEAAKAKIQNIDNIVRAKLGKPPVGGGSSGMDPARKARLEELRRKKAEGAF